MKSHAIVALATAVLCLAGPSFAQEAGKSASANAAAVARAMDNAMTPGDCQKRLEPMLGSFDLRVPIWVDPAKPPIESSASAVSVWVLGNRFVQTMFVQVAEGLNADDKTLRLVNASPQTVYFSDRPVHIGGHITMPALLKEWTAAGPNYFAADPPKVARFIDWIGPGGGVGPVFHGVGVGKC
jgi:hypothetical protein